MVSVKEVVWHTVLCDWLFSLSKVLLRFLHAVAWIGASFLFMTILFHCMTHPILFVHSSVARHLGCLHFLSVMSNATMNIHVQLLVWVPIFISFGSYGNSIFRALEALPFPKQLHHFTYPAAAHRVLVPPRPHQHCIVCLFDYSHSRACEVLSHWFRFAFPR